MPSGSHTFVLGIIFHCFKLLLLGCSRSAGCPVLNSTSQLTYPCPPPPWLLLLQGVDAVNSQLLFHCEGMMANASEAEIASATAPSAVDPTVTVVQAFSLSSRPSATRKIVLDFDGHITTGGTYWNTLVGRSSIETPAYDKDNSPTTWSAEELSDIVAIWRSVSEDFSMFDVDVTTADPGDAALSGTGIRVAIGGSWNGFGYSSPAGGLAYLGGFGLTNTPCYVFAQNLGPHYPKFVMEAVSHEVAHTLGLLHDGAPGTAYYSGQGDWAPIMVSTAWLVTAILQLMSLAATSRRLMHVNHIPS